MFLLVKWLSYSWQFGSYPTMATVGRVLCCGWVEALVDSVTSLPPFSQSKGSFSVMIRSFMLFSNTDMSSWTKQRDGLMNVPIGTLRPPVCSLQCVVYSVFFTVCTLQCLLYSVYCVYLVVWFGVVVQGQDMVQEDIKLWRHVFEQHPMVITLFNLTNLFLQQTPEVI